MNNLAKVKKESKDRIINDLIVELKDEESEKIKGGLNPQPLPPGLWINQLSIKNLFQI